MRWCDRWRVWREATGIMDVMTQQPDSSEPHNSHGDGWKLTTYAAPTVSLLCLSPCCFLFLCYIMGVCTCGATDVSVCMGKIDCNPVLTATWSIDVQSKHCSFACRSLERGVNEASVARSACFLFSFFSFYFFKVHEVKCTCLIKRRILK